MKIRVAITIIMLILYVGLFNLYLFELTRINIRMSKIFYNCLTWGALSFFILDLRAGFVNSYHKQFNLLLFLCVLINGFIITMTHLKWIKGGTDIMFYSFDFSILAITLTIFICEIKYKTFHD